MPSELEWLSLEPGEDVVWTGKPRLRRILGTVAGGVFWTVAAIAAAAMLPRFIPVRELPVPEIALWGIAGLVVLVQAWQIGRAYLRVENTDYVLTDQNVYKKTGIASENVTRVGLDRIQNTQLQKSFRGNLFDYGSVAISTAGSGGSQLAITDLDNPREFRDELQALARTASDDAAASAAGHEPELDPDRLAAIAEEFGRLRETADRLETTLDGDTTHDSSE